MVSFVRRLHGLDDDDEEVQDEDLVGYLTGKSVLKTLTQIVIASNFQAWPEPGGILDQDMILMEDMAKVLMLYQKHRPEPEDDKPGSDTSVPGYEKYLQ